MTAMKKLALVAASLLFVSGCASLSPSKVWSGISDNFRGAQEDAQDSQDNQSDDGDAAAGADGDGKFYLDDGPPADASFDISKVKWVEVTSEPIRQANTRPYVALGKQYTPYTSLQPYRQQGEASWYGKRYHGRQTASGEVYDMYEMTAAHTILPIPSYVRVTRVATGESVTVRINDRGPFLGERVIDLSYAAAAVLGYDKLGTAEVIVEAILPDEPVATALVPRSEETQPTPPTPVEIEPPQPAPAGDSQIYIQLGAFSQRSNAENMVAELKQIIPSSYHATLVVNPLANGLLAVQIGPYQQREQAVGDDQLLCRQYQQCGFLKRYAPPTQ